MTGVEKFILWFLQAIIILGLGYGWRMYHEKQWVNKEIAEIREIFSEAEIMLQEHEKVLRAYNILVGKMEADRERRR